MVKSLRECLAFLVIDRGLTAQWTREVLLLDISRLQSPTLLTSCTKLWTFLDSPASSVMKGLIVFTS